jgi:acyl-CoA reductase-like NAD-dependent aldehyde dehydrogenase
MTTTSPTPRSSGTSSGTDWVARAAALTLPSLAIIDGAQRASLSGETFAVVTPRDGRRVGHVAACRSADIDLAVHAARAAFDDGRWSATTPQHRKGVLLALADLLLAHREELALLESIDVGKPIAECLRVDVPGAATSFRWYAEAIDKVYDEVGPTGPDALSLVTREPVGVVGAVTPWNYPLIVSSWKLAPALAAGNSVVHKPAEQSPLTALRVAELALEAGLPPGVLNVVPGFGPAAGEPLGRHMDVDKLAFTGSTEIGKRFLVYAGESNLKSVQLECGGKSPQVVLADAPDLRAAASGIAAGIFYNAGQTCNAGSRVVVDRAVKDELLALVAEEATAWQPGDPLDEATTLGAIVDGDQHRRVVDYIRLGTEEGARVAVGSTPSDEERGPVPGGWYVAPTVFDDVTPSMRIATEEIFGPVLAILTSDGPEEALTLANDSEYGLAAAVWTADLRTAHRMARALRAGTVWVNTFDASDVTVPFGGMKQSGSGRDKSLHALDAYTHRKTTWLDLS